MSMDRQLLASVRSVLERHAEVRLALLFGSRARGVAGAEADLDLVSFNLMLAVQACTDVASHLIADEGWPPAKDLADAFHRLHEHGVITEETSQALARATGLRNIVAHVYAQADPELVFRAASMGLEDLERFSREVARCVQEQGRR